MLSQGCFVQKSMAMKPERTTKYLVAASWSIPLAMLVAHLLMMLSPVNSFPVTRGHLAVVLLLVGSTPCALVLAAVCGFVARRRSRRLHGGRYSLQATLGLCLSLIILFPYVIVLALGLALLLKFQR